MSESIARICKDARPTGTGVIDSLRESAAANVAAIDFPTVRHEDWRFTNLAPVAKTDYVPAPENGKLTGKDLSALTVKQMGAPSLVFINGVYAPGLSSPLNTENAVVLPLSEAAKSHADEVAELLGSVSDCKTEFFTAVNTALFTDGAFVLINKGKTLKEPVYIVHVSDAGGSPAVSNSRNLIAARPGSSGAVAEHYVSAGGENCLSNNVSEVFVEENADLEHYRLQFENTGGVHISTLNLLQQRSSNSRSHAVLAGGRISRNNVHPVLAGEGCDSVLNGLFMPAGNQHMDNFMKVEHAAPHCDSRQLYNGVLNDKASGVFHGRIVVHEGAVKTDAKQTNRNLLLSDTARIDTKPQLEIYNDDVKCTHGATIGQMDEDSVFYLRSRGIPEKEARSVILRGFTAESVALMRAGAVREFVESGAERWFARALEGR